MNNKIQILHDLQTQLSGFLGNEFIKVYLFGSQAKNTQTTDSDYDILILLKSKNDWKTKDRIIDICYEIDLKHNILIDPHILAEEELSTIRGKQPIFNQAILNGISL